ncbi:MAG TPA: hypothetical protein VGR84_19120 [Candidatus Acidoferrales bacterium]|nr:hypothetical protein [Candidatus Acidoferrales bacterium]
MPQKESQLALLPAESDADGAGEICCWALVEMFGHQRIVGHVSQQQIGPAYLLRVDVPDLTKDGKLIRAGFTRYLGVGAIYSITPIDEAAVRELLPRVDGGPEPRRWRSSVSGGSSTFLKRSGASSASFRRYLPCGVVLPLRHRM